MGLGHASGQRCPAAASGRLPRWRRGWWKEWHHFVTRVGGNCTGHPGPNPAHGLQFEAASAGWPAAPGGARRMWAKHGAPAAVCTHAPRQLFPSTSKSCGELQTCRSAAWLGVAMVAENTGHAKFDWNVLEQPVGATVLTEHEPERRRCAVELRRRERVVFASCVGLLAVDGAHHETSHYSRADRDRAVGDANANVLAHSQR